MLEAATWRTKNRKHFDVVEELYAQANRPLRMDDSDLREDDEYAAVLAHQVGSNLLGMSIGAGATKDNKTSNRRVAKAWKEVSGEAGARASVYLTLAVMEILAPEIEGEGFDQSAIAEAYEVLQRTFSVSAGDLKQIEEVKAGVIATLNEDLTKEAVERGGLADKMAVQRGQTTLSYYAMKIAGIAIEHLPAFEPVHDIPPEMWGEARGFDWLMTFSIRFGYCWKAAKEEFLALMSTRTFDPDSLGYRLVATAHDHLTESWEWDTIPGVAVAKTGDKLSNFREEYNLVLDAIALGYWIRRAEIELTDQVNGFDDGFKSQLREKFADEDEQDTIITIGMNEVRSSMPAPFAQGEDVWTEVRGIALGLLDERGKMILSDHPEFDEDGEISDEMREFALGLGYGLAITVDALGIEGTRPRQV
jgi:hypothetical protein